MISPQDRVLVWSSQLKANDFPPVCAMTGAPAETWRKFNFATRPAWAWAFLLLLCTGVGIIPIAILTYVVSRRASGHLPLTRASRRNLSLAVLSPLALEPVALVLMIAGLAFGAGGGQSNVQTATQTDDVLVYTTWVKDDRVTNGPEPGYRPKLTGLTSADITNASAARDSDPSGDWVVDLEFNNHGSALFTQLTQANVAACPGNPDTDQSADCAERHLAIWLGLTQKDIDQWENLNYVIMVSQPWKSNPGVSDPRPKFLADLLTLEVINDGSVEMTNFSQDEANEVAADINQARLVSNVKSTSGGSSARLTLALLWLGLLLALAGLVGLYVVRSVYGPTATVMERAPNAYDYLVEIRHVHPAFIVAVQHLQQARAAQYSYQSQPPPLFPQSK